jgi:hypothetical protein
MNQLKENKEGWIQSNNSKNFKSSYKLKEDKKGYYI